MRIVFLLDIYPHPFKPYFDVQFGELVKAGHAVTVLSLDRLRSDWSRLIPAGVGVRQLDTLGVHPLRAAVAAIRGIVRAPGQAVRLEKDWRGRRLPLLSLLKAMALNGQLPSHEPELYFAHNLAAAAAFWFVRMARPGVPYVMYYHGGELPGVNEIPAATARLALSCPDLVFTNSRFAAEEAIARGCVRDRIRIVPVGFRIADYHPDENARSRADGETRLVWVGRVAKEKALDTALRALVLLRERCNGVQLSLTIVGDGPDLARVRRLADEWGLASIVAFKGRIDHREVLAEVGRSTVLVLTSVPGNTWAETQACVMQEALLMKTPVVASALGGVPESLPEILHPFLYRPGDAQQLAEKLFELLFSGRHSLAHLGEQGRRFALLHYDVSDTNQKILAEIERIATPS